VKYFATFDAHFAADESEKETMALLEQKEDVVAECAREGPQNNRFRRSSPKRHGSKK
jgi:hypothetical protein